MYVYNLGHRFQQTACQKADKAAIIFPEDGGDLSFSQLETFSNKVANWLCGRGLTKGQVVAIQNDKTAFGFAAMLACLKLGLIYTNFDYDNPKERLSSIFNTARPALVLADRQITESVRALCLENNIPYSDYSEPALRAELEKQNEQLPTELSANISGDNPAYIMFTSGSTGIPKGVLIKHSSLLNFIDWAWQAYELADDDILTNVNPIYFDNSVFDFYCSVFNGLTMAAFPKSVTTKPKEMLRLIDASGCTFWFSVPSFLIYLTNIKLLSADTFKSIRAFAFGGEAYPKELLKKLYDLYSHKARFFNVYGPTEGTCICSAHKIQPKDFDDPDSLITLGRLAPNFDFLILDDDNQPSSLGELCLLGPQLALGYYNDQERTDKSFQPNPHNNAYNQVMYRTGDLVEEKGGQLYFRGRADNQIKHMGYRIELEEIEAGLMKLPYINQGVVVHGRTETGFSRLTAYLTVQTPCEQKVLRDDLRQYLPEYMIPNFFEILPELPKNPNGKVDRRALKDKAGLR